ncbi:MAG: YtxH domain-containing protein [Candidatus Saganbacteria bacterium]|nr:YtxH domain-containing protein [Candidatus Saganbacteria bacterium]
MSNRGSHFLEGLMLGGLLGAAIGILFAPSAGEKLRIKIRGILKEMDLEEILNQFGEAFDEGLQETERVQNEIKEE